MSALASPSGSVLGLSLLTLHAVWQVTEKLRLELSNEEASAYFENLIDSSTSALFPQVVERLHQLAQYWRS
jgi:phosphatidylinositol 3-kinase